MSLDIERITEHRYLCVNGHLTDHRTDCWIQWTNLTVSIPVDLIILFVILK